MLFELMRMVARQGDAPRSTAQETVASLQCLQAESPPAWCCPKYLPVIDRLLWLVSYRRVKLVVRLGTAPSLPS